MVKIQIELKKPLGSKEKDEVRDIEASDFDSFKKEYSSITGVPVNNVEEVLGNPGMLWYDRKEKKLSVIGYSKSWQYASCASLSDVKILFEKGIPPMNYSEPFD